MVERSNPKFDSLETLAVARFSNLSEAEQRLLRAAPRGEFAVCGPNLDDNDPNNKAEAGGWGSEREIRGELIRWLCVDPEASGKGKILSMSHRIPRAGTKARIRPQAR